MFSIRVSLFRCREGYEGDLCEICAENSLGCEPTDSIADGQIEKQSAANDEVNAAGKTSSSSMYVGVGVAVPVLIAVVVVLVVVLR